VTGRAPLYVAVESDDPVLRAGVLAQLRGRCDVMSAAQVEDASVTVLVVDRVDDGTVQRTREAHRNGCHPVVLVVTELDDVALLAGVDAGASGFVRRSEAEPERLVSVVTAAARGDASVPPDLVGGLLTHLSRLQSDTVTGARQHLAALCDREVEVLRLAADGLETSEIARRLAYSERTVKGVIHDVTARLSLKNRTHAVAYAVRHGLI
jgi:DNA-binding NarL/FixJ family response regulator